jgi:hypothetical protein
MRNEDKIRKWVSCWQKAGVALDQLQDHELSTLSIAETIESLSDAFESARLHNPMLATSGLIEQQQFFMKFKP